MARQVHFFVVVLGTLLKSNIVVPGSQRRIFQRKGIRTTKDWAWIGKDLRIFENLSYHLAVRGILELFQVSTGDTCSLKKQAGNGQSRGYI